MEGPNNNKKDEPICCVVIGMAGSGKSTLIGKVNELKGSSNYYMNLDPAVRTVPFETDLDIRDTVKYTQVMDKFKLGPNGAIMTSLNLFATRFDEVLKILDGRTFDKNSHVFIDTPGQIEVFNWSASGQIILESIASSMPTCILFVIDTPRSTSPITFMSNMLYACSILYKTQLPFIIVFNKTDLAPHRFALEWMNDFEVFLEAVDSMDSSSSSGSYSPSFARSLALVLDSFYESIPVVGVSADTGAGIEELFAAIDSAKIDFNSTYKPVLEQRKQRRDEESRKADLESLQRDLRKWKGPVGEKDKPDGGDDDDAPMEQLD